MSSRLLPRATAALLVLVALLGTGCSAEPAPAAPRAAASTSPAEPSTPQELESLLLQEVPSGLPLVPDADLDPPAGEKTIDDVAGYGADADQQRQVLEDYGYLRGWERFWRSEDALTSVFIDQFRDGAGAGAYAEDLARNDAEYYGGVLDRAPADLPENCVLMVRDDPVPQHGLAGPAAFAWCASGVFTVAIAAVAATPADARTELTAVTTRQLDRLPGS